MEVDHAALIGSVSELVTTWGLRVVGALAVLIVGWIIAGVLRRGVARSLERGGVDATLTPFLSSLAPTISPSRS